MEIDKSKPVLVTGANGYVASWIVKKLLEQGFTVRATVRDKENTKKTGHLLKAAENTNGKLELWNADLLHKNSFLQAMSGCEVVIHTASPFKARGIKDAYKELVEPALEGTRNVLQSVNDTPSVKRVVLTSSIVAMMGDNIEAQQYPNRTLNETYWNTHSNINNHPYPYSKTLAEQEAWKICKAQSRWDLVTINPGFVLGPSLTAATETESMEIMKTICNGELATGAPALYFAVTDVRDVAEAHLKAAFTPSANGRNFIANKVLSLLEMADLLRPKYGNTLRLPKKNLPKFLFYIVGPFLGVTWKFVSRNIGHSFNVDTSVAKKNLGITYHDVAITLNEHIEQMMKDGLLKTK